jgi:hypothetical protein
MDDYERQALRGSALALAAAVLAYAASYVHAPGPDVAAVFAIAAVLALSMYYFLDEPSVLAGAWVVPTVAIVLTLVSENAGEMRIAAISLAALSVFGVVTYPLTATAAKLGERVRRCLRGTRDAEN